ncbi:uncharacterized protein [Linepithema humile]|uniref:uncharacterized protein n=1 Tax=Linepithema humile TaxID=83485 RepID=UPI0006239EA0|nr:PREDICTED: uncharacterized protein LOC105676780 [Linepithema humile]
MRFVVFGLILLCCYVSAIETNDYFIDNHPQKRTKFENMLESMKIIMRTGNDTLGIPVLDPFTADEIPIQIDEEMIKLDALLENVNVQGLSEYDVNSGDFKIVGLKIEMNLTWPLVVASTKYALEGKTSDFEIFGKGDVNLSARGFNFVTVMYFMINGKYLKVKSMETELSLKELDFKATGLFDDEELSELISAVISDMVPQLIDDYQDTVTEKLNGVVMNVLNEFLSDKTLGDLLKLLG